MRNEVLNSCLSHAMLSVYQGDNSLVRPLAPSFVDLLAHLIETQETVSLQLLPFQLKVLSAHRKITYQPFSLHITSHYTYHLSCHDLLALVRTLSIWLYELCQPMLHDWKFRIRLQLLPSVAYASDRLQLYIELFTNTLVSIVNVIEAVLQQ